MLNGLKSLIKLIVKLYKELIKQLVVESDNLLNWLKSFVEFGEEQVKDKGERGLKDSRESCMRWTSSSSGSAPATLRWCCCTILP